MSLNRLTLNYNICKFMILSKSNLALSQFQSTVNNSTMERTECIRYLGEMIDEKLTWKNHVEKLHTKLSKICDLIFTLRHYIPLATCKLVYYGMFQSVILYSLINWGKINATNRRKLEVLQNKFVRASLFSLWNTSTKLLYHQFHSLKLKDIIGNNYNNNIYCNHKTTAITKQSRNTTCKLQLQSRTTNCNHETRHGVC